MLSLILVETTGISKIQHCCGSTEIMYVLSELEIFCSEESCETVYESHHHCGENSSVTNNADEHPSCGCSSIPKPDYCQNHTTPGFHRHHHDDNCISTDFLQLRPEQKQDSVYQYLQAILPVEIKLFDFIPLPVIIPLTDKYAFTIPKEAGRYKLALYSVYLI